MNNTLSNKTFVVTGATSGIGLAVVEALAHLDASVIGVGRSEERCRKAEVHFHAIAPRFQVTYLTADLSLQSQVHQLAGQIRLALAAQGKTDLDGLVNNAGTFTYWQKLTPEGFETQWAVNHLAPFLLTQELLPLLQAAPSARIVTTSSGSHYNARLDWKDLQLKNHYNGLRAYEHTKLANVLFTTELNRRLGAASTVRAFAADPGLVKTDIGLKGTPGLVGWIWKQRRSGGKRPEDAARGIVFLLSDPSVLNQPDVYWKNSRPKRPGRQALDPASAARLWAISEQMCGIK
jgi:retinol dehydrogenase 12